MSASFLTTLRVAFLVTYASEICRLYYATTPCPQAGAWLLFSCLFLGSVLCVWQLSNRHARIADIAQCWYSLSFALSLYTWGTLRGGTLGALKAALGLTATVEGTLPKPSSQEISCFAAHWGFSSFVITESRWWAVLLVILSVLLTTRFWMERART